MRRKKIISKTVIIICCIVLAVFFIFPILLLFINSFKSLREIYVSVLRLPETLNLDNYISAFKELDYLNAIKNSLIVTCTVTVANVVCCSMAAWVLVRYKTKTSKMIFTIFSYSIQLSISLFPSFKTPAISSIVGIYPSYCIRFKRILFAF